MCYETTELTKSFSETKFLTQWLYLGVLIHAIPYVSNSYKRKAKGCYTLTGARLPPKGIAPVDG